MTDREGRWSALTVWLLALLVFVVPLLTGNLTGLGIGRLPLLYDTIALPRLVVTLVLATAAWCTWWISAIRGDGGLRLTPAWAALAALLGWSAVSLAVSPHRSLGVLGQSERLEGVVTFAAYALLYGIGLQAVRSMRDLRLIAACIGGAGIVASLYGLVQFFGLDPSSYLVEGYAFDLRRAFAGFGNPDFLAGFLVLVLPVVVGRSLSAEDRVGRVAWGVGAAIVAAALFATFVRGAWLVAVVILVVLAIAERRRGPVSLPRALGVLGLIAAGLALVVVASLSATGETNVVRRVLDITERGGSAAERARLITVASSAASARPILGYGPDAFLPAFRLHRAGGLAPAATLNNAHSWPFQMAATLGLPGAALLVAAIVLALWRARRLLAVRGRASDPLTVAVYVGCLGFGLYMLVGVAVLGATVPFWILLGALGSPQASRVRVPSAWARAGSVSSVALLTAAVVLGASVLAADRAYLSSRVAFREDRLGEAAALAELAIRLDPLSVKYRRGLAEVSIRRFRLAVVGRAQVTEVRDSFRAADVALLGSLRLDPADYPSLAWRAGLQASAATYLGDERLKREAVRSALAASRLDEQHAEVSRLIRGQTSPAASAEALEVPPLP